MGLYEKILQEPVSSLATREAICVDGTMTVREAIETMQSKRLGCAFIVDADGKLEGAFTEGQLAAVLLEEGDVLESPIEKHMVTNVACVRSKDPISCVIEAMQSSGARFVCVLGDDERVESLTGQKGVMEYIAEHFPQRVHGPVRRVGAKPYTDQREGA